MGWSCSARNPRVQCTKIHTKYSDINVTSQTRTHTHTHRGVYTSDHTRRRWEHIAASLSARVCVLSWKRNEREHARKMKKRKRNIPCISDWYNSFLWWSWARFPLFSLYDYFAFWCMTVLKERRKKRERETVFFDIHLWNSLEKILTSTSEGLIRKKYRLCSL